ncbi:MAG: T9SS type A sorting domain-containing protein [Bacteroidia bacterium]
MELIDGSGKLVEVYKSQGQINIANLRMGVYTVKITLSGAVHYRRLVVVK